jgi:fatty acid desaturase
MAVTDRGTDQIPRPLAGHRIPAGVRGSMVAPPQALPDVLPTSRLLGSGKPVRELRDGLRRIDDARNAGTVLVTWAQAAGTIALALYVGHPLAWLASFVLMGALHARMAILMHEAAHKLLFTDKRVNDAVGRWLAAYPALVPMELYRRSHFAHHREEFGPEEPDLNLYQGYPITRASMKRKLWRDLRGTSGWKSLKVLLRAIGKEQGFGVARKIALAQIVLATLLTAWGVAAAGWVGVLAYPVLWVGSWLTIWRVINRLRSIAEHGGLQASPDRRRTTHHVRQSWLARFWIVPLNTGWHLAHHVDMGVPFRNLPRLHDELVAAGWVTDGYVYPSYRALWRDLSSRPG